MQAARQLESPDSRDYVSVDQAAQATGESLRVWQRRAQREAMTSGRPRAYKAPPPGGGKPVWYVHRSLDARLSRYARDERAVSPLLAKYPQHLVDRALRRAHWLKRWRKECQTDTDRVAAERVILEARRAEPDFKVSVRSLYLWQRRYKRRGVEGLVDAYGRSQDTPTRSPEAIECFYDFYHTQNRLSASVCHDVVCREAARHGWAWPPSYTATTSWLAKHDDLSLTCLMREGVDAWARRYLPYLRQDYSKLEPGEMFVADHSQLDLFCMYKGKQIRPWCTAIQDLRSRCITGWHIGPVPHQDAILAALRMAFRDWAIPRVMRIDNGRDFTSKPITGYTKRERDRLKRSLGAEWGRIVKRGEHLVECTDARWLGITGELDVDLIYAIPYSPWSKGTLERWFGTMHGQHDKLYSTYCGNKPENKPEGLADIRLKHPDAVPTLDEVRERFAGYLDTYHRTVHGSLDGWTPLAVWKSATRLRRAVGDELAFLMDVRGLYKVTANGVSLKVGSGTLHYGAKSQALKQYVGRKVLIALDPSDVSHAWAFTPDREKRQLLGRLDSDEGIAPYTSADDAREAIAEMKREQSVMHKARRAQARRTLRMAERMRQHSQAKRAELLATGTDDVDVKPTILPVRTGFEGVSKPARSGFDSCRPMDDGDVEDLFCDETETPSGSLDDDDGSVDDLFIDDAEPDDGLAGLL